MPLDLLDIDDVKGSAQFTTTVFKASKGSRLGINLAPRARGPHTVTVITKDGLLAGSGIAPGHLLTSINGVPTGGLTTQGAIAALKDAVGEIALGVTKPAAAPQISFGYADVRNNRAAAACKMNAPTCESLFAAAGVPRDTYEKVYKMVEDELLPVALSGWILHKTFYSEMAQYTKGPAQQTNALASTAVAVPERRMFLMSSELAALQRNANLVAIEIKDRVNATLSKYGVIATCALKKDALQNHSGYGQGYPNDMFHIVGLEFHLNESL